MARIYSRRMGRMNEGGRLLWAVVQRLGSQAEITRALAIGQGIVGRWLRGDQKPSSAMRIRMRDLWAIPFESWELVPSKPFDLPGAAA